MLEIKDGKKILTTPVSAEDLKDIHAGDIIILLGGRTGRDGIGGATGSSKVHTEASIEVCGGRAR